MKVKTADLIGRPLSYAVAICYGLEVDENSVPIWFDDDGLDAPRVEFSPWEKWYQGGPILDREEIGFAKYGPNGSWKAVIGATPRGTPHYGPTPLIAAMRCYVASKLGEEIEIPEGLI
jgi:hypothetical protein